MLAATHFPTYLALPLRTSLLPPDGQQPALIIFFFIGRRGGGGDIWRELATCVGMESSGESELESLR